MNLTGNVVDAVEVRMLREITERGKWKDTREKFTSILMLANVAGKSCEEEDASNIVVPVPVVLVMAV